MSRPTSRSFDLLPLVVDLRDSPQIREEIPDPLLPELLELLLAKRFLLCVECRATRGNTAIDPLDDDTRHRADRLAHCVERQRECRTNPLREPGKLRHSGYPGGLTSRTYTELLETKPAEMVRISVRGMLPHNTLGRQMLSKLKVYAGPEHPHIAQNPTKIDFPQARKGS